MKICIDDGSTNIKLAWTENGQHQGASALMTLIREHKQGGHNATH